MGSSDNKILAALTHLGILLNIFGLVIAILIFAIKGKDSPFISYSAKQAIGWQILAVITQNIVGLLTIGTLLGGWASKGLFSLSGIISIIFIVVGIIGAIKALDGERYKYPLIGDFITRI